MENQKIKAKVNIEVEVDGLNQLAEVIMVAAKEKLMASISDPTTKIGQLLAMFGINSQ